METRMSARERAKEVICDILHAAGGSLDGKTRLFKAFYAAHLFYWRDAGKGALTDYPIVKMPHGPGIDNAADLLGELQAEALIGVTKQWNGPYPEFSYELDKSYQPKIGSAEYTAVAKAVNWVAGKQAVELSEETHERSRSWIAAQDGEELNIYVDLLDDDEFSQLQNSLDQAKGLVAGVFA